MARQLMGYTECSVTQPINIFKRAGGGHSRPVTLDTEAFTDGVCKAGTPIDKDGKIANNDTVYGILKYDVYHDKCPQGTAVYTGVIDRPLIEAHSGITLDESVINALPKITFEV